MSPTAPRLRILSVGGNAVSAFLSWRLQATNACDVTLVWKSGFDSVSQYGISFRSTSFGNERFKPRHVVRTPEEASNNKEGAFDYVLLCVKALPDVYDLAAVIESVVTPQHTCILVNTTHTLGVESHLEQRFPTNVVLSLVSVAEIAQLGASEFEHKGSTEIWVGPANKNASIPTSIQQDMAEALAMTLSTGQVECKVANNIRQQQYERMIGPIAFHPASVIFETASHSALVEKVGLRQLVNEIFDEIIQIAHAQDCKFPEDFKSKVMEEMLKPTETNSIMYQDFTARRPMEVETYLGSPIKLALSVGVKVPRIETLYALLHHMNIINQQRPKEDRALLSPTGSTASTVPRMASAPPQRPPMMNGRGRGGRTYSMGGPPPGMRRAPPMNGGPPNGYGRPMTGQGNPNAPRNLGPPGMGAQSSRRGSMEHDLEDFSHLVLYDDIPEAGELRNGNGNGVNGGHIDERERTMLDDRALREREYMLRQREAAIREQELRMRQRGPVGPPPGSRRGPPPSIRNQAFDDDDEDDFVDPAHMASLPMIDPDNFDMMSVTSKRNRKTTAPPASQLRKNPDTMDINVGASRRGPSFGRPTFGRNRSSARIMPESVNGLHDALMDDPMMRYSDNRYGGVDRQQLHSESRSNSLTAAAARLDELTAPNGQNGAYPGPRRVSHSPGNLPFSPHDGRGNARRSPPNGYMGVPVNGRPSPPGGMRQPISRHPGGQGHSVAPQQVEQHAGVSALRPPKASNNVRSLTGSASASAGSGDSANIDSENSAHSSQSSLGPHAPIGVR